MSEHLSEVFTGVEVVIELQGGSHVSTMHNSRKDAQKYIGHWVNCVQKSMASGDFTSMDYRLEAGETWAILSAYIIGMYIPAGSSANDRIAASLEQAMKAGREGESWRGE